MALGMSVRRAQREIDAREFAEWLAYYELEPYGEERSDLRAGIVASVIANVNRGKSGKAFKPIDFMPKFRKEKAQGQAEMEQLMQKFATHHNMKASSDGGSR